MDVTAIRTNLAAAVGAISGIQTWPFLPDQLLAPAFALEALHAPPRWPTAGEAAGVLYIGLAASVAAFICWNRGVAIVGANAAGFTLHLLPAFGTMLAMLLLGEAFHAFHAVGIATVLLGVVLATRRAGLAQGLR